MIKNSAKKEKNRKRLVDKIDKILFKKDLSTAVDVISSYLKKTHNLSPEQIKDVFSKKAEKEIVLPVSIFNNAELSSLETIVKYLKESLKLKYHEIAVLLNRNDRTIWTTYKNAKEKRIETLPITESEFSIPLNILSGRKLSVLESIVSYLKDNYNLRYSQISALLNRDERNIWTVYSRALKKGNKHETN